MTLETGSGETREIDEMGVKEVFRVGLEGTTGDEVVTHSVMVKVE